jgi:hypothetical protein
MPITASNPPDVDELQAEAVGPPSSPLARGTPRPVSEAARDSRWAAGAVAAQPDPTHVVQLGAGRLVGVRADRGGRYIPSAHPSATEVKVRESVDVEQLEDAGDVGVAWISTSLRDRPTPPR